MKDHNYQSSYSFIYLYIAITLKLIYIFLDKVHTFGFILKKYANDMHFSSQYMITKACLTHAQSLYSYAVLTGVWCLEMKHDHKC
jgi:hypothetical protein